MLENGMPYDDDISSNVSQIFSNQEAFAAINDDGSVVACGGHGAEISHIEEQLSSGVNRIYSTTNSFAALKDNGSVVTWGLPDLGGDSGARTTFQ